jgi:hypothetical protein
MMNRYIKPNDDRYQFMVINTVNGYSIEVLVVSTEALAAITPSVAAQLHIKLPDTFRLQSCAIEDAEKQLEELAALNGWVPIE